LDRRGNDMHDLMAFIDTIALWTGRIIIYPALILLAVFAIKKIYHYYFQEPYCPNCWSRGKVFLIGNNAGGHRCSTCDTYYWYEKGESHKEDPIGFTKRLIRKGIITSVEDDHSANN